VGEGASERGVPISHSPRLRLTHSHEVGATLGSRYHVKIDGTGYLVAAESYRRIGGDGPAGLKSWTVSDWRRGDGHLTETGGRGDRERGGFRTGFGVDVGTSGRLALGPAVAASLATTEDGIAAMLPFGGKLYAVSRSSGAVRAFDGSSWSVAWTAPAALRSLGSAYGELMLGGANGKVYSYDPFLNSWAERFTVTASGEVTAAVEALVEEPVTGGKSVETRAVFGLSRASGAGQLKAVSADAATTLTIGVGESHVEALAVYRGKLYVATSWGSSSAGGRLLVYGPKGAGSWWDLVEVAAFSDAAPVGLAVADGVLWIGMANGRVLASDGSRVVVACDLMGRGVPAPGPLRGLVNCGERLYVGYSHPLQGVSLLHRLPAPESGAAWGLSGALDGWVMECGSGVAGSASALGVHGGTVFFASDAAGVATVYGRRLDAWRTSGELELATWDGGDAAAVKILSHVVVNHEPLRAGESVRVSYSLDGGAWVDLGSSDVAGSAFMTLAFPGVVACRQLGMKVELASGSAAAGPAVTGISLAYSLAGSGKRHWRFDARCEGVPGVPLRLLDGSVEQSSGSALSSVLWCAYGAGVVDFEDLDGATYRVLFRSLEEDPGKLPQERGAQTAARCELVEW
jgi:hypothetical protein